MSNDNTDELIIREETSGYSFKKSKEDIELAQKINKIIHYDFKDNIKNDIFIVLDALVKATELKDLSATQTLIKNQYYIIEKEKERHFERVIQKQKKEIKLLKDQKQYVIDEYSETIEKKDKIIDLMSKQLAELRENGEEDCFIDQHINVCVTKYRSCEDCIKQYFERKVEK